MTHSFTPFYKGVMKLLEKECRALVFLIFSDIRESPHVSEMLYRADGDHLIVYGPRLILPRGKLANNGSCFEKVNEELRKLGKETINWTDL